MKRAILTIAAILSSSAAFAGNDPCAEFIRTATIWTHGGSFAPIPAGCEAAWKRHVAAVARGTAMPARTGHVATNPAIQRKVVYAPPTQAAPRRDSLGEAQERWNRASNALDGTEASVYAAQAAVYRLRRAVCEDALKGNGLSDSQLEEMCR